MKPMQKKKKTYKRAVKWTGFKWWNE